MGYWVYLLRCGDGSLYTGCTNDLARRLRAHQSGRGAKYTRSRLPVELVYREEAADRSAALRREAAIKRLTRAEKLALAASRPADLPPAPRDAALDCRKMREKCECPLPIGGKTCYYISVRLCAAGSCARRRGEEAAVNQKFRRGVLASLGLTLLLTASGCGFSLSPEDLYSLPQLPAEYTELNSCINAVIESGAEYAAPHLGKQYPAGAAGGPERRRRGGGRGLLPQFRGLSGR